MNNACAYMYTCTLEHDATVFDFDEPYKKFGNVPS